ncbi:hypothetical protein CHUAL_002408 [Chamberlinius hualienensis]
MDGETFSEDFENLSLEECHHILEVMERDFAWRQKTFPKPYCELLTNLSSLSCIYASTESFRKTADNSPLFIQSEFCKHDETMVHPSLNCPVTHQAP